MFKRRMVFFGLAMVLVLALSGVGPRAAQAKVPESRLLQGPVVPYGPDARYCIWKYPIPDGQACYTWRLSASLNASIYDLKYFSVNVSICDTVWTGNGYMHPCHSFYAPDILWYFGDGTPAVLGTVVSHQYSTDGKYLVKALVPPFKPFGTEVNEFTLMWSITVETHDTAVTDFKVHKNMHSGQVRKMSVNVISSQYDETVEVQLYKRYPGADWQQVNSQTQAVPVVSPKDAVTFNFEYEVPPEDAAAGEVVFKAVAVNVGKSDARPADNEMISEPVEVKK